MRRITVVLGVCVLAAASTAIAAGGSSAERPQQTAEGHQWVLPGIGHAQVPAVPWKTCFVSSASQGCSLTPCKGFVTGSPDWVPITRECGGQRPNRTGTLVRPVGPLFMGSRPHLLRR